MTKKDAPPFLYRFLPLCKITLLSFAIDLFPEMDPDAMENFYIQKVSELSRMAGFTQER